LTEEPRSLPIAGPGFQVQPECRERGFVPRSLCFAVSAASGQESHRSARSASGPDPGLSRTLCRVCAAATCIRHQNGMRNAAQPGTRRNMGTPGITDQEHANVSCPFPGKSPTAATQTRMGSGGIWPAAKCTTLGFWGLSATVCLNWTLYKVL